VRKVHDHPQSDGQVLLEVVKDGRLMLLAL